MPALKARRKGQDLRQHPAVLQLSELQEDILWEFRNHSIEASEPEWCSAADTMVDQGLVDEKDGLYTIKPAGLMALKWVLDSRQMNGSR